MADTRRLDPRLLLAWMPPLGTVDDQVWGASPSSHSSRNREFGDRAEIRGGLQLLPWLAAAVACWRRRHRAAVGFALSCALGIAAVVLVSLFGDRDDIAKHAQLAPNFALASLGLVFAALVRRALCAGVDR